MEFPSIWLPQPTSSFQPRASFPHRSPPPSKHTAGGEHWKWPVPAPDRRFFRRQRVAPCSPRLSPGGPPGRGGFSRRCRQPPLPPLSPPSHGNAQERGPAGTSRYRHTGDSAGGAAAAPGSAAGGGGSAQLLAAAGSRPSRLPLSRRHHMVQLARQRLYLPLGSARRGGSGRGSPPGQGHHPGITAPSGETPPLYNWGSIPLPPPGASAPARGRGQTPLISPLAGRGRDCGPPAAGGGGGGGGGRLSAQRPCRWLPASGRCPHGSAASDGKGRGGPAATHRVGGAAPGGGDARGERSRCPGGSFPFPRPSGASRPRSPQPAAPRKTKAAF